MRREDVLRSLAEHRANIEKFGIQSLSIFGSVARDEAKPESDVDVLVDVNPPRQKGGRFRVITDTGHPVVCFEQRVRQLRGGSRTMQVGMIGTGRIGANMARQHLGDVVPLYQCAPGGWVPTEADRIIAPNGGWHNPRAREVKR